MVVHLNVSREVYTSFPISGLGFSLIFVQAQQGMPLLPLAWHFPAGQHVVGCCARALPGRFRFFLEFKHANMLQWWTVIIS